MVPRSGLHVSRVLGNEIKDVVCPPFADSISEGDVRLVLIFTPPIFLILSETVKVWFKNLDNFFYNVL